MTKEELIQLLKTYRESKAKLRLREKDLIKYNKDMKEAEKELEIIKTRKLEINSDIRTKNKISDTTANAVIRREQHIAEMKEKIAKTEEEIEKLKFNVEQIDDRLICLNYKEKELLTAYYIDNRTAEEIGTNLYWRIYNRTCSAKNIYIILKRAVEKMSNL